MAELIWAPDAGTEFQELRRRAEWVLEQKAKPLMAEEGYYDPLVYVFRGSRFLNAVAPSTEEGRSIRDDIREAVEVCEGTAWIFTRTVRHAEQGEALVVSLDHPEGRVLLCAPFTRADTIVFQETEAWEGPVFGGGWEAALWQ